MGGSRGRDVPSNIIVLCSVLNGLLESDAGWAERARAYGWKLGPGDQSTEVPVWYPMAGESYVLDNEFGKTRVGASAPPPF